MNTVIRMKFNVFGDEAVVHTREYLLHKETDTQFSFVEKEDPYSALEKVKKKYFGEVVPTNQSDTANTFCRRAWFEVDETNKEELVEKYTLDIQAVAVKHFNSIKKTADISLASLERIKTTKTK